MTTIRVGDAQRQLPELVAATAHTGDPFEIVADGARAAVLLGANRYDGLLETIALLSDPAMLAAHEAGVAEIAAGDVLDADALALGMREAGRDPGAANRPAPVASHHRLVVARSAALALTGTVRTPDALALFGLLTGPLVDDPRAVGTELNAPALSILYSCQRGATRVVFRIDEVRRIVEVTAIGPRADAYADHR
jgi:prevent-host-death family protein